MITSWIKYVNRFGPLAGSRLFYQIRYGGAGRVVVPGHGQPVFLRPHTSDGPTFEQVLVDEEYQLVDRLRAVRPVRTIIDAGANVGITSAYFATQFPQAEIVAIEPDAGNFELLQRNIQAYPNVHALQTGLWNRPSSLQIVDAGYGHYGFMVEEVPDDTPNSFQATSINAILEERGWETIDILKMDIEGSEREVFERHYESWLPRTKCIFIELHDRKRRGASKAVFRALDAYNFSLSVRGELLVFLNEDLAESNNSQ